MMVTNAPKDRRRNLFRATFAIAAIISLSRTAKSQTSATMESLPDLKLLVNEPSRAQLFSLVRAAQEAEDPAFRRESIEFFNLYGPFRFPNDVQFDHVERQPRSNSIFGIDISHHNHPAIPIQDFKQKLIRFVYMKASQGTGFKDGRFAQHWAKAGGLPRERQIHRGAYHFLSATQDGAAQANTYLRVLRANGGLRNTDMPPVVDLEWDKASLKGADRWAGRNADEIMRSVKAWLTAVEAATGRKPMIYTARSWIRERPGLEARFAELSNCSLWIADYSKTSRASESPRLPAGTSHALWQYTDAASMATGFDGSFDANVFKGSEAEFQNTFSVQPL